MDEASIETTEPIFELATECETLFSDHLSKLKNEPDLNGAKVVGEYQQRFSAWAAFLGVFAVSDMCLDRRLRSHAEVQDLVLRLLDIMKRNLVHLFEEEDVEIYDLDQATSPPQIRVNLESLRGIEAAVDRLNHLGRTIQQSSEAGQAIKVGKFITTFDSTSFEEIARLAVKSFYPDASAPLLEQLIQAMTDMYEKFHYRRSRQVRLRARPRAALFTIGEDPASDSKTNTGKASLQPITPPISNTNKQLPHLMSRTHLEDRSHKSRDSKPTSLDSREFSRLFSRQEGRSVGSKTRSILVSQAAYPQPSEESLVCEWCFVTLSKDELKGEKWKYALPTTSANNADAFTDPVSRKHLNEDFKPFVCISEKCKGQISRFATSRAWFSHMLEAHGQNWHREIHLPVWWICPLCNSGETTFSRAQDLSEHISKLHDDIFTKSQIQVIVHQSQLRSPRPQDMCPLCCLSMRDEQDRDKKEQHLKVAQPDPSFKDQAPGESHKRAKTEAGSFQPVQHSDAGLGVETDETGSPQSAQNTQRVNIEAIARHVASHLQGIMLFTLRMMSLDVQNATADEKSLSSSTDHDSSRAGSGQQHSIRETDTVVDISEVQADNMEIDDDPSIEDTIPDCEHNVDWQDVINDTQQFSGSDSFLQEIIRSGAFHNKESTESSLTTLSRISVPLPRNEHFICPEDLFNRLFKQSSRPDSCVSLIGLSGIGKSQLALEFTYRTAAESPTVWVFWICADTEEHIEKSFRRIAQCVGLPVQNLPWNGLYRRVCDWLSHPLSGRWIIILDGANDPKVLNKLADNIGLYSKRLPPIGIIFPAVKRDSSIIVTTRNKDLAIDLAGDHRNIIEVGPMPVVEATSLFRKILGPKFQPASDMNAAIRLVKGLGLIPLAITQAALYIDEHLSDSTLANYLEKLEESAKEKTDLLHFDAKGGVGDDSKTIFSTWQASLDIICSQRPSAANLLSLMSFFDRRGIPKWLLISDIQDNSTPRANSPSIMGRLELDDGDGDTNSDTNNTFDGDIDMLMNHYFIAANRTRDIFEMYGLVQLAAQMNLSDTEEKAYCEQFIRRLAAGFPRHPLGNWSTCQELFAHVQAAVLFRPSGDSLEDWATLLYNGARYARLQGDYETAKQMSNEVSKARQTMRDEDGEGGEDMRSLENSSLTALILMDQGLYEEADKLLAQVTDAFEKVGENHPNTLTSLNNVASIYRIRGEWKIAEKLLAKVRYERAEVNEAGPSALATLANLASTYRAQGRYIEATALQEVVLESCKVELGEGHPQTLTNMSNLASIYRIRGELGKAEELQIKAMNLRDMKFGREHPDTLTSMNSLASIFRAQGRLGDAEELQMQVVGLRRTKLGPSHPNTMASMNNLALIFCGQGKIEKAVELQSLVMDMCKIKFGDRHPHTLTSIHNLALIRKSQGQHEEAMRLMLSCSEYRQIILGREHPYTVSSIAAVRRWSE